MVSRGGQPGHVTVQAQKSLYPPYKPCVFMSLHVCVCRGGIGAGHGNLPPQDLAHQTCAERRDIGHLHSHPSFQRRPLLEMGGPRYEEGGVIPDRLLPPPLSSRCGLWESGVGYKELRQMTISLPPPGGKQPHTATCHPLCSEQEQGSLSSDVTHLHSGSKLLICGGQDTMQ